VERVFLIRYGELGLKGQNRKDFERALERHIKMSLRDIEGFRVSKSYGRIFVKGVSLKDSNKVLERLSKVSGIVSVNPSVRVENEMGEIKRASIEMVKDAVKELRSARTENDGKVRLTFKVNARRADKSFPLKSLQLNHEIGAAILKNVPKISVDVHNPHIVLNVEVRDTGTYICWKEAAGPGGLPLGASGKGILLISGGIDSPVAGYLGIKRGVQIDALHFWSYPITSERAREKVIDLCRVLKEYNPYLKLYIAPFAEIQTTIMEKCPERYRVIIMRRMMMRVASELAKKTGALAIFTGENLGQVASQTLESLKAIGSASEKTIIRPLVCFDKQEIIQIARKIGTYEISCLPYEDCCTVFVPKHPVTKPKMELVHRAEEDLAVSELVENCVQNIEEINLEK